MISYTRKEHELLRLLALAHRRLDERGTPPAIHEQRAEQ